MFKSTWQKVVLAVFISGMSSLLFTTVLIWYGVALLYVVLKLFVFPNMQDSLFSLVRIFVSGVFGIYWFWYFMRYFCRAIKRGERNGITQENTETRG